MRLIDADAVIDIINRPSMMRKSGMIYAIKHLPTIDAVERRWAENARRVSDE